jgi:hypothetical protein
VATTATILPQISSRTGPMHLVLDVAPKKKSAAVKAGDQGDQAMNGPYSINPCTREGLYCPRVSQTHVGFLFPIQSNSDLKLDVNTELKKS